MFVPYRGREPARQRHQSSFNFVFCQIVMSNTDGRREARGRYNSRPSICSGVRTDLLSCVVAHNPSMLNKRREPCRHLTERLQFCKVCGAARSIEPQGIDTV